FLPFQPREEVPSVLSSADLSLVTLKSGVENECVPSKVYWILASGRPLVASVGKDSEIARLTEEARCGICVDPDHPESLAAAILQLKNDPQRRHEMGQQGREFVVEHYSRQSVAIQFNNLIESACAPT
ncbi:MAG: glycosyltransferase, partial [Acidobacteriaceae bacterium]|nr:glycosyltransferase [Acidobacteriaceae bacterium]